MADALLAIEGLTKHFGGVVASDGISLAVPLSTTFAGEFIDVHGGGNVNVTGGVLKAPGGNPGDAFTEPLQPEHEQQEADDQPQGPNRNPAERGTKHHDNHGEHPEARDRSDDRRAPASRRTHANNDRDHLGRLDRRGQEGRDQDREEAG